MSSAMREPNFLGATAPGLYTGKDAVLKYNGFIFNDRRVADHIHVTKLTGVDDPDVRDAREENPDRDGETAFDAFYGGQTMTIQGYIKAGNFNKLEALYGQLKDAFDKLVESPLSFRWLDWYDDFTPSNALVDYIIDVGAGGLSVASDLSGLQPADLTNKQFWLAPEKYAYGDSEDVVGVSQRTPLSQFGPILRRANANQFLYVKYEPSNGRVALYKRVGGTDTLLDNVAVALPSPAGNLVGNWSLESDLSNWTLSNYIRTNLITNPSLEYGLTGWSVSIPTRTNLMTNPSFEVATTGWSVSTGTLTRDTGWAAAGGASGRTVGTVTSNDVSTFSPVAAVVAGTIYSASIFWKIGSGNTASAANGGPRLIVQWDDGSNTWALGTTATPTQAMPAIGTVGSLSVSGTAPVNATQARFRLTGNTTGSQTVDIYWDAAQLTATAAAIAYFDGDTPGYGWTGVPHASTSTNTATITNLVTNPSFEVDTAGWATTGTALTAGATLARTTATSYIGGASGQVDTTGSTNQGVTIPLSGTFKQGVTYTFTVRLKGNAGGETIDQRIGLIGTDAANATQVLTTSFAEYVVTWIPSADRTGCAIVLRGTAAAIIRFFIDAVGVFASTNNAGYFDGTFPGAAWTGTAHGSTSTRSAAGIANLDPDPNIDGTTATGTQYSTSNISALSRTTAQAYKGTQSLSLTGNGVGSFVLGPASGFRAQVVGGGTYTASLFVRSSSTVRTWNMTVRWFDSTGAAIGSDSTAGSNVASVSTGWTQVSVTATAPNGAVRAMWRLNTTTTPANGEIHYVDGIIFVQASAIPAYFDGSTTGAWWTGAQSNSASILPALTQSSDWAASGTKSARYSTLTLSGESTTMDSASAAVTAGSTYAYSVAYNATALAGNIAIRARWSDGSTSLLGTVSATGTGTFTGTVAAPGGVTSVTIRAVPSTVGLNGIYLDAVMVVAGSPLPPYFDGDTAGASWSGTPGASTSTQQNTTLTRSNAWSAIGGYSARIQATPVAGEAPVLDMPSFTAVAGASVTGRLSAHAVTMSGGANLTLKVHWSDGTDSAVFATINAAGDTSPGFTLTVPAGVTSGNIRATLTAAGTYDISFDAVVVVAGSSIPSVTNYVSCRADGATITYGIWATVPDDFGTPLATKTFTLSTADQATFPNTGSNTHGVYWTPGGTSERLVFYDIAALNPGDAIIYCRKFAKIESDDTLDGNEYKRNFMISLRSSSGRTLSRKYKVVSIVPSVYALTFPGDGSGLTFPSDGSGLIFGGALGTLVNLGRAPAGVILRMYGPLPNPAVANQLNGSKIGINGTIADGDYYEFNTLDRTVVDSAGTDQYDKLTDDTNWLTLEKGSNNLLVGADSVGANSLVKIYYQNSSR